MSRQQFTARNNIGSVLTFQKSGATASFDPNVLFGGGGSRRVSWKLDNGTNVTQTAGNTSLTYTGFTSDPGVRTIQMKGNSFRGITGLSLDNENLYGHIDLSGLNNWGVGGTSSLDLFTNPNLTGITNPNITIPTLNNYRIQSTGIVGNLDMTPITANISIFNVSVNPTLTGITHNTTSRITNAYDAYSCGITGNLNLPYTGMSGTFQVFSNSNLTGITHAPSSQNITLYFANSCKLTGNLDLTPLSGLGGSFAVHNNTLLTGITHSVSSQNFSSYYAYGCNLTGNLNLTPLSGLGGDFRVQNNSGLTSVTHSVSSQNFTRYYANNCNLTGNLDLTPLSGLGGDFRVSSNSGLTSVTHSVSSQNFTRYYAYDCNLTGNLNVPFSGLGGVFWVSSNPNLTGITHVPSSQIFNDYYAYDCNLTGNLNLPLSGLGGEFIVNNNTGLTSITHVSSSQNFNNYSAFNCNLTGTLDISPLTNLGYSPTDDNNAKINLQYNPNLTNIIFPNSTQFFRNGGISEDSSAFSIDFCDLGYVDFKPLSGATLVSGATVGIPRIILRDNNMSAADVNHILVDFSGNTTHNPTGWSNVNLNIGGTNDPPDSASGGYNGLTAISFLTGSPRNWVITHT
jgi:hypothetical protein